MKYDFYAWMHDELKAMVEDIFPHPIKAIPEYAHVVKVVWEFMYRNKLYHPDAVEYFVTLLSYVGRVEYPSIYNPVEHSTYFAMMLSICHYADIVTYPFFVAKLFEAKIEKEDKSKFKFEIPRFDATFRFEAFATVIYSLEGERFEPVKVELFKLPPLKMLKTPPATGRLDFSFFLCSEGAEYLRQQLDQFNQNIYRVLKKKLDKRIEKIFQTSLKEVKNS